MQGTELIQAMLMGNLDGVSDEILFLYSRTGLIHLFSASGFHMASALLLSNIAGKILHPVKNRKYREILQFFLSFSVMTYFGIVTSWSSPMVRAYTYTCLRSLARFLGHRENKHWVFLLSLLTASVFGKGSTLSFLLSASGMAGILYLPNLWGILYGPWLATLPISVYYFHLFSLSSLFWNLTIGTLISWTCLPLGIIALLSKSLHFPLNKLELVNGNLALYWTSILERGDRWLGLSFWVPTSAWIISFFAIYFFTKMKNKIRFLLLILLLPQLIPIPVLSILNIGQGDAIFLRTKSDSNLIDTGPPGHFSSNGLANLGISKLENLLITHPDLDHRGGFQSLSIRHKIQKLWIREESALIKGGIEVLFSAERASIPIHFLTAESQPKDFNCWQAPVFERNDLSPLCRVRLANGKFILTTGDISAKAEQWFVDNLRPFPNSDYLKIAHHASRFSSSSEFLWKTQAKIALISVGMKNRYGHPHPETLKRISDLGITTYRTDFSGTLNFY